MVVQSQFISQFGFPQDGAEKYPSATIESLLQETISGEWGTDCSDDSGTKVIRTTNFTNEGVLDLTDVVVRTIDAKKVEKKQLKKGDIILEKSGGTKDNPVGRLVYFEEEGVFLANNFTQVLRPAEDINSRYLFAALYYLYQTHKPLIKGLGNQTNGIQNLKVPQYLQLQISVPDRTAQDDFERICRQADKSKFDGLKSQFIEETKRWSSRSTIGGLVDVNITKAGKKFKADSTIQYIDISSVDNATNTVLGATEYVYKDAPSRAQQCIKAGDILVSTVRPNLKNIAVNHLSDNNLIASSGFCVLRPKDGYTGLLLAYILSDEFTEKMTLVAKGTNYPAVHDSDILDYEITVPEKDEVKRIDSLYRQADKSKYLS